MTTDAGVVRSVSWRDLCPWTILFRLYRVSVSLHLLLLAFVGAWLTSLGWQASRAVCLSDDASSQPAIERFLSCVRDWPESVYWQPVGEVGAPTAAVATDSAAVGAEASRAAAPADAGPLSKVWHEWLGKTPMYAIMEPVMRWFDPTIGWGQFAFYFLGGLWSLLVWSLLGGAMTRVAVVRLGRDERVGLREALEFSGRKLLSILAAPLLPLAAVFGLGIPLFVLGLVMRTNIGVVLGGLLWLPVGLIGFSMTLFAIGVLFGWPLMWSAISAEGSDAFDAISRSYAYTYQRPLQYVAYASAALILGFLGWIIVGLFCQAIVQFSLLAVGTGTGDARLEVLRSAMSGQADSGVTLLWAGSTLMGFVNRCFLGIQVAYSYSFMWTAAAAIYLLLRYDADQTEMDDVYLDEDESVSYGLPPLTVDSAGVPGTDEERETATTAEVEAGNSPPDVRGGDTGAGASATDERESQD